MKAYLQRKWFLVSLVVLITVGLSLGMNASAEVLDRIVALVPPRLVTIAVLFLMAFSLDSRKLHASFRAPAPVIWAAVVNSALIPLAAWALMPWQRTDDYKFGLMIAASVPCTLAAASVWTRKAGGNDAVSLLVTLLTNALCFAVTPFWLSLTTSQHVELDGGDMALRLLVVVLIPTLAGQVVRQVPRFDRFATRYKTPIGVIAQVCILSLVFAAACNAGRQLNGNGPAPALTGTILVWGSCVLLHAAAMTVGLAGSRGFGFSPPDAAAVAFASSQKTLPIGIYVAAEFAGQGVPFAVFPMIMYHASQLFIDTLVADRMASRSHAGPPTQPAKEPTELPG